MNVEMVRRHVIIARCLAVFAIVGVVGGLTGCTTSGFALNGNVSSPAGYTYLTGNWVFQTVPTASPTPFTSLAGYVSEENGNPGINDLTTAALQAQQPSSCYLGATLIPLQGALQAAALGLRSFSVNGQFITINAAKDSTATHLMGTYSVDGGCASGATGTLTGTRYSLLTGIYSGAATSRSSSAQTLRLALTQNSQGSGAGVFLVSGSATFSGFTCFTKGILQSGAGTIIGNTAVLNFLTDDVSGAQLVLYGTIDPAADTLAITSGNISSGNCSGAFGSANLTLQ